MTSCSETSSVILIRHVYNSKEFFKVCTCKPDYVVYKFVRSFELYRGNVFQNLIKKISETIMYLRALNWKHNECLEADGYIGMSVTIFRRMQFLSAPVYNRTMLYPVFLYFLNQLSL